MMVPMVPCSMQRMSAGASRCARWKTTCAAPLADFAFYGPTCDDADYMAGPFELPADIQAGDYIEIGMLGAYGTAMKTRFNGFGAAEVVVATDEPMASLYTGERVDKRVSDNVVSLR